MAAYPKFRQAVGVFYDPDRLQEALVTLTTAGVDRDDLALLAGRETIDTKVRSRPSQADSGILEDLLQAMIVVGPVSQAGPLLISRGRLADFLSRSISDETAARPFPDGHLPERHAAFLRGQLDAGACLLWVTVRDEAQDKRAATALLEHSRHQVQLHDFSS